MFLERIPKIHLQPRQTLKLPCHGIRQHKKSCFTIVCLTKCCLNLKLPSLYDLLGFFMLLYLPVMGGYYASETAQEVKGRFRDLNQQKHAVSRLFFLYRRHLSLPQMCMFFIASE